MRRDWAARYRVKKVTGVTAALTLIATVAFGQSGIPPENQARLLDAKIATALKSKSNQALIDYIEQYRKLGSVFPNDLLVTEAEAASEIGDPARALAVLDEYFKVTKKTNAQYEEAISIYPQIQVKADNAIFNAFVAGLPGQMKRIPAGTFTMGTDYCVDVHNLGHGREREWNDRLWLRCEAILDVRTVSNPGISVAPAHRVSIPEFWLQSAPMRWDVLKAYARLSGHPGDESKNYSYPQILNFIDFLKKKFDRPFRLPTEAEWEYAMVSGHAPENPWEVCSDGNSCRGDNMNLPVVSEHLNGFGVTGINNEGTELLADCWHENYVDAPTDGSPWDLGNCDGDDHVVRSTDRFWNVYVRWRRGSSRNGAANGPVSFRLAVSTAR